MEARSPDNLDPNLELSSGNLATRYPNPFFDLAQQYMPPTIKELFRWCTFYYYNSPIIGAAIRKVSRYPITDLIFDDELETVRQTWTTIFNDYLHIKDRLMEINLDYYAYGNAFVSMHLPFTRFLICQGCRYTAPIRQWDWNFRSAVFAFQGNCPQCGKNCNLEMKDIPYRDLRGVRIIRWNPENMQLKFNEYTGRYVYMYMVPSKLKNAIMRGDKDILEDIPPVVLEAIKKRRMIRFNHENLKHLKAPTLAEMDQGWGKPLILNVLKDMYYFYTLRRAQEAIANEHIVPFDIMYPLPNGQQDPYIHTDLGSWRARIENIVKRHRRDPNFKAVVPIPIGFGRLGGDGKALLLSPEMNFITQTVVGGMGLPQEFLFGGLNYTGSSISLRTLENDFIQNRSQMLDLVVWFKLKLRAWMSLPNLKSLRFADFRMADDVQRNQQLIGLNAQGKVSDQTLLTELGYDYDQEVKKRIEEIYVGNYLMDLQSKGAAKSQGEAGIISQNYNEKLQEMAAKAQQDLQAKGLVPSLVGPDGQPMPGASAPMPGQGDPSLEQGNAPSGAPGSPPGEFPAGGQKEQEAAAAQEQSIAQQIDAKIQTWANKLTQMQPQQAQLTLMQLKTKSPDLGQRVEKAYKMLLAGQAPGGGAKGPAAGLEPNMTAMPEQRAPRRAGAV